MCALNHRRDNYRLDLVVGTITGARLMVVVHFGSVKMNAAHHQAACVESTDNDREFCGPKREASKQKAVHSATIRTTRSNDEWQAPDKVPTQGQVRRRTERQQKSQVIAPSASRAPVMPIVDRAPSLSRATEATSVNEISQSASHQSDRQRQQQKASGNELRYKLETTTRIGRKTVAGTKLASATCLQDSNTEKASKFSSDHQEILANSQTISNQAPRQEREWTDLGNQQDDQELSSNSFLFWKFLSNLPKSITQRSKSTTTLTPEVAGYLASKQRGLRLGDERVILGEHTQYDHNSNRQQVRMSFDGRQAMTREHTEHVGSTRRSGEQATDGHRLIRIIAPTMDQQHDDPTCKKQEYEDDDDEDDDDELHGSLSMCSKQVTKLSIATTTTSTTSRSSVSSISSCVLSTSSDDPARIKWSKKMDFLLSIIGFAVDLANIWRFPYLVYKNGGGVFLIPYVIMLIFGGIPLFFLELCLGQFVKKGPITVWNKICPSMKGVGYCSIMISWYVSFYYNVLIAWSVYFIYRSLLSIGDKMPWEDCDNTWNSKGTCVSISHLKTLCSTRNETLEACRRDMFAAVNVTSPASEFFVKELSQIDQSTGLDDMGFLRPELVLCTMVVYTLHYFSLFRGLETSGKVVWVTATAPYMILSILLVRGLFLPGAAMGIEYYLSPRLEKLGEPQVWIDAAGQVFYSIGVGFGVHLTYASFNSHNNDCYRDCLMTSAVNAATSVYSGLVVFVYLGYMAQNLGIEIDKVASEGYSLVFEVYPEALTTLPFARFWSILFFIMLLTLGIDSAMGGLEAVITGLEDEFKFARRLSRGQLTGLVIVSSFLPALISCTQGGAYTLFWFDIYSAGVSLLFSALFETIGVVYCYGLDKFIPNIESMLGKKPNIFYIICWKYISPLFLGGVIFMSIYTATVPTYRGYTFPLWSVILGWCLAFSSVAAVPTMAIWHCYKSRKRDRLAALKLAKRKNRVAGNRGVGGKKILNHHSTSVSCGRSHAHSGPTTTTTFLTASRDLSPTIGDGLSSKIGEDML